ncbi:MAG: hypothetical protein ACJAYF_002899 [Arenicella sp.]|jgi:hypothetical protein
MKLKNLSKLILFISITLSVNAKAENVAMIADIEGKGAITLADSNEPAGILLELASGSALSLEDDSKLTLFFFASSEEYTYEGPGEILIEQQQPKLLSGKQANTRNLNMVKLAGIAAEDEGSIDLGVLKLRNFEKPKLQLISPVNTKVLAQQPKFSWTAVEGATTYQFILSNELGKKIVDVSVTDSSLVLPKGTKLASGTEYTWEIISQTSEQTEYRAHAYFSTAEQHVSLQVESSRPDSAATFSEKIVYARLLEKLGLKQAAKTIWQELAILKPNSEQLQTRIGSGDSEQ